MTEYEEHRGLDAQTLQEVAASLREVFADPATVDDALEELGWNEIAELDPATTTTLLFDTAGHTLATTRLLDDVVRKATGHAGPVAYAAGELVVALGPVDAGADLLVVGRECRTVTAGAVSAVTGFDTGGDWHVIEVGAGSATEPTAGPDILALARRALSAEINGMCRAALELAAQHTSTREQYGRYLATFQAVRHALAESYAAIELSRVTLEAAWVSDDPVTASTVAKHQAGASQATVMQRTVHVLGAMGLTLESDMHRYVSRAAALDTLLGDHNELAAELGAMLLHGGPADPVASI